MSDFDHFQGPGRNPRTNPQIAYEAFMSMPESEWNELELNRLLGGGILTPAEHTGWQRASKDRADAKAARLASPFSERIAELEAWLDKVVDERDYAEGNRLHSKMRTLAEDMVADPDTSDLDKLAMTQLTEDILRRIFHVEIPEDPTRAALIAELKP